MLDLAKNGCSRLTFVNEELIHNDIPLNGLEMVAKDKLSSLFCQRVKDEEKRFIILPPEPNVMKLFTSIIHNKLECFSPASLFSLV